MLFGKHTYLKVSFLVSPLVIKEDGFCVGGIPLEPRVLDFTFSIEAIATVTSVLRVRRYHLNER